MAIVSIGLVMVAGLVLEHIGLSLVGDEADLAPVVFHFSPPDERRPVSDLRFVDGDGRATSLGDFRGRVVLLNLWATWCVPCRHEMPALDRLQAKLGGADFVVLPLSIDRGGLPPVKRFYAELGLKALGIFAAESDAPMTQLKTPAIPTTLQIDREGREMARQFGAAAWDSPAAIAMLRQALD